MIKSIGAIAAGFFVTAVIALAADEVLLRVATGVRDAAGRINDTRILVIMLTYTAVSAIGGGYVTAWLAPARPLMHAMVLGGIALALSVVATVMFWESGPVWYHLLAVGMVLPAAWLGGTLVARRRERPTGQSRVRSV